MTRLIRWLDSRVHKPSSKGFERYEVLFLYCGSVMHGFAGWQPKDGYTDGDWTAIQSSNGNLLGGEVLFWRRHATRPKGVEL